MEYQISYILKLSTPESILKQLLDAGFKLFRENEFTGNILSDPEPDSPIPIEGSKRNQTVYHCLYNDNKEPDIKVDLKWIVKYTFIYKADSTF